MSNLFCPPVLQLYPGARRVKIALALAASCRPQPRSLLHSAKDSANAPRAIFLLRFARSVTVPVRRGVPSVPAGTVPAENIMEVTI